MIVSQYYWIFQACAIDSQAAKFRNIVARYGRTIDTLGCRCHIVMMCVRSVGPGSCANLAKIHTLDGWKPSGLVRVNIHHQNYQSSH